MKILWLNWRCIKHPLAGGAEVYTHEVAKRLVKQGSEVVLITSRTRGLPEEEIIEGYKVIRSGGRFSMYLYAREIYRRLISSGWIPDVVIDEVNTIPFFTPKYVKQPVVMLIHQLCKDCWKYAIHPLAQPIGWWLEKTLHKIYIKSPKLKSVITVSPSTRQDLVEIGYPENKISIVYNGLDWGVYKDCANVRKEDLVVYISRITPYKKIEDLIKAWKIVEKEKKADLVIAGRAEPNYLKKLTHLAKRLHLRHIEFQTNLSQYDKKMLMSKAKALVYTSVREGWGQTVLEAAACGAPSVAYNVPGLRDSVKHMETGLLVKPGDVEGLAKAIITLLTDTDLWKKLSENAFRYAQNFDWDKTAEAFLKILKEVERN